MYTEAQATRGEKLWGEKCAKCHGPDLSGGDAPSLVGSEFSGNWDDLTLGDLADRLRISMPQDNPQSLSREETAELVATILKGNRMPAGQADSAGSNRESADDQVQGEQAVDALSSPRVRASSARASG